MTARANEPGRAGMAGHTPGEWRLVGTATIRAGRSDCIATVNRRNRAANAKVLVAAPDLLAALETLCDCPRLSSHDDLRAAWAAARAAIAKARGA